jgi:hypothetical protein
MIDQALYLAGETLLIPHQARVPAKNRKLAPEAYCHTSVATTADHTDQMATRVLRTSKSHPYTGERAVISPFWL